MSNYGVSERLQGLMCTEPVKRSTPAASPVSQKEHTRARSLEPSLNIPMDDLEGAYSAKDPDKDASLGKLSFAQVTNQIWHFCSVDHGARCMQNAGLRAHADEPDTCIGYNSLYVTPNTNNSNGKSLPEGLRLWSWLVLFDDGMLIDPALVVY